MKKVLIADEHAISRRGIRQILAESGEFQVVEEAINFQELQTKMNSFVDAVIMELFKPIGTCMDLLRQIRSTGNSKNILILSNYSEDQYGIRVLKSGALGFLSKACLPEELVIALRKVSTGKRYVSPKLTDILASQCSDDAVTPLHQKLSNREHEVLLMIGAGLTPGEISKELHLSVKTISTYRTRILEKMGKETNAQLIHYVVSNELRKGLS